MSGDDDLRRTIGKGRYGEPISILEINASHDYLRDSGIRIVSLYCEALLHDRQQWFGAFSCVACPTGARRASHGDAGVVAYATGQQHCPRRWPALPVRCAAPSAPRRTGCITDILCRWCSIHAGTCRVGTFWCTPDASDAFPSAASLTWHCSAAPRNILTEDV